MKKAISIFRIAILALMGSVGVLFLLVRNRTKLYSRFSCISSSTRCLALPCLPQCVCSFGVGARPTTGSKPLMNGAKR